MVFFVAADLGGDGFEAAAQLVDLDGQAGQGAGVLAAGPVLVDDGAQVGPPVESGAADAGASTATAVNVMGCPAAASSAQAASARAVLVVVSWHWPGR